MRPALRLTFALSTLTPLALAACNENAGGTATETGSTGGASESASTEGSSAPSTTDASTSTASETGSSTGNASSTGALGCPQEPIACAREELLIAPETLNATLGEPAQVILDLRPSSAYADGHIPGALNLPATDAEATLTMQSFPLPIDELVVCYCEGWSCEQSEHLGKILQDQVGCQQVRVLAGGWLRWTERGGPIERGKAEDHG